MCLGDGVCVSTYLHCTLRCMRYISFLIPLAHIVYCNVWLMLIVLMKFIHSAYIRIAMRCCVPHFTLRKCRSSAMSLLTTLHYCVLLCNSIPHFYFSSFCLNRFEIISNELFCRKCKILVQKENH